MIRGLVLGGGGSRGAYQIGVWQALNELGMDFDIITGTSIGALNGALMVQGDFDTAKKMWEEITYSTVIGGMKEGDLETVSGATKLFKGFVSDIKSQGALDITPLEELVRKYLSEEKVRASHKKYGFVTVEFPKIKEIRLLKDTIPEGQMADYLLASAACFPFFKTKVINKTQYVDGGYRNNLPIDMAIQLGAEEIIAVDLENLGFIPKMRRFNVPVKFIRCYWSLGLFLNFDESRIRRNMTLGYLDTMRAFNKLEGLAYAFNIGETERNYEQYKTIFADIKKKYKENILDDLKKPIADMLKLKIRRTILTRYNRKLGSPESIRRMAEIAGEVCGLPIAEVYFLDDFNERLLSTYEKISNADFALLEDILGEDISIIEMTSKISQLDLRLVVSYIYRHIDNLLERGEKNKNLWVIAGIATNEFITAVYLYALEKYKRTPL